MRYAVSVLVMSVLIYSTLFVFRGPGEAPHAGSHRGAAVRVQPVRPTLRADPGHPQTQAGGLSLFTPRLSALCVVLVATCVGERMLCRCKFFFRTTQEKEQWHFPMRVGFYPRLFWCEKACTIDSLSTKPYLQCNLKPNVT